MAVAYERGTELIEGLASYVELRALGRSAATLLLAGGFGLDEARRRCYAAGAALAFLLDRAAPAWREEAELARPGWRLVVEADAEAPLWPRGFDPMNVHLVGSDEVLHTRYLALGNAVATLQLLDQSALTVAAGEHPLFGGMRRVVVTGLPSAPRVRRSGATTVVEAPGCRGEFAGARVEHRGQTLTVQIVEAAERTGAVGKPH